MPLKALEQKIAGCRLCGDVLGSYGVEPRPIFSGGADCPVFLLGQAPGRTEYERRAPFQGDAGKSIKALFASCGLRSFDDVVYQTSVTKCFPGRRAGSSTDRMPGRREVTNCLPYLTRQLDIIGSGLLVCLGGLAWRAVLSMREADDPGFSMREIGVANPGLAKVPHVVGRRFLWRSTLVVPMIHPAGSANGTRAQYPSLDRRSKELLKESLDQIGVI